ncbi:energy transducer TonB [Novosphingobium profundi]|uniref:energy transducer TonB family protein n=1 Tax=Novosphingobium profundi TaxID=1774954 RepID=UPI001CFF0905|nr:energy transducer TonB [Novosphingobium profundi]
MYLAQASKWDRQRLVGLAGSALVNGGVLAIFVGLASGAVHETGAGTSLTVIAFSQAGGARGAAQSAEATAANPAEAPAPRPPRPQTERSEPSQVTMAQNAPAPALPERAHAAPPRAATPVRADLALTAPAVMIAAPTPLPSSAGPQEADTTAREPGAADGSAQPQKKRSESRAQTGGGAAKYAAAVMRHLMRYRRQNTVGAGAAYIHFTVIEDGRCRDIGVARSSGSSRFDHAAMQLVRRAAPFPQPPHGQPRSFNFEITGS